MTAANPRPDGPIAILGGAGGIGRVLAKELAGLGQDIAVLDLAASLERHSIKGIAVDATDPVAVDDAADTLKGQYPDGLSGFVALAGWNTEIRPLSQTPPDYFDDVLSGNLRTTYLATRAIAPQVRDGGAIILCASGLASFTRPGFGAYAAAKAGVISLTKTFALELAPRLTVNAVGPALVDTAFIRGGTGRSSEDRDPGLDLEAYKQATPLARVAEPADVTGPIRFLLGPDSRFMTGQVLWVNGGGYMP